MSSREVEIVCPECGAALLAPSGSGQRAITCWSCAGRIERPLAVAQPQAAPASAGSPATKACPICGETILAAARKCKHCKEILDEDLRLAMQRDSVEFRGKLVRFPRGSKVSAPRCLICGGTTEVRLWRHTFKYTPPWVWVGLLGGVLPALILQAIAQKKDELALARCRVCKKAMERQTWLTWAIGVGGLFAFPAAGGFIGHAFRSAGRHSDALVLGVLIGFAVWFLGIAVVSYASNWSQVSCRHVDEEGTTLQFPTPAVTQAVLTGGPQADRAS